VLGLTKKPLNTATLTKRIQRVHSQIPPRLSLFTGMENNAAFKKKKIYDYFSCKIKDDEFERKELSVLYAMTNPFISL